QRLIAHELRQLNEEGIDPAAAEAAATEALQRHGRGADEHEVWSAFQDLPQRADWPFVEPSTLADIRAARPSRPTAQRPFTGSDELLFDKMYGAWLGRCVGCALGKPVEIFLGSGNESSHRQKRYLTAVSPDEWPLRDYFPGHSPAESETGSLGCPASTRDQIAFMETDDDIRYTVLGQLLLQERGGDFASADVAHLWLDRLPYTQVFTAEAQA